MRKWNYLCCYIEPRPLLVQVEVSSYRNVVYCVGMVPAMGVRMASGSMAQLSELRQDSIISTVLLRYSRQLSPQRVKIPEQPKYVALGACVEHLMPCNILTRESM
jgi:hypothetical protein